MNAVLQVRDLTVSFSFSVGAERRPAVPVVRGVDLTLQRGEVLGLVGESGTGKTLTALSLMGLAPPGARVGGSVRLLGEEVSGLPERELARIRGRRIAMVFQDPLHAFTPVLRVGDQIAEALRIHQRPRPRRESALRRAVELLDFVGVPQPSRAARAYPHELSGGMRQRAMIAMAMSNGPDVLLADEPTSALDATVQAQVLEALAAARRETGAALLLVTHDLGVVAGSADRVAVLYAGRIVETGTAEAVLTRPRMPYTVGLVGSVPRLDARTALTPIPGTAPAPGAAGPGCAFAPRCPLAEPECVASDIRLLEVNSPTRPDPAEAEAHEAACRRVPVVAHRTAAELFPPSGAAIAAAGGGAASTPAPDGVASTPARDRAASTPAPDGTASTPAHDGTANTPAHDGTANTPAHDGTANTPAHDGTASTPAQGGTASTPAQGGTASTPAQGGTASTPAQGGAAAAHAPGGTGAVPAPRGTADTPSGEVAVTPTPGMTAATPAPGGGADTHPPGEGQRGSGGCFALFLPRRSRPALRLPEHDGAAPESDVVLRVSGLARTYVPPGGRHRRDRAVRAVEEVDVEVRRGETLALVGESGAGKSTVLLEIASFTAPEAGVVEILGQDVAGLSRRTARLLRGAVQIVPQDPMSSLDPRMPVGDIVAEPLHARRVPRAVVAARIPWLLAQVGLTPADAERYPHQFSGGQRQRIAIARALAVEPALVLLDEPVSALDVSVQAQILDLLLRLKRELGPAYLLVSHDLAVVRQIADRVSVMYAGRTVETGLVAEVFDAPRHPYARALLSAVPLPDPVAERARRRVVLPGEPPAGVPVVTGCRFRARCPVALALPPGRRLRCETEIPRQTKVTGADTHTVACHFPHDGPAWSHTRKDRWTPGRPGNPPPGRPPVP
ncbi:dipeptide ABC transporter ATP-binding protein [Streptomyces sp. NPDC049541]|uniref:dipeptide ABC transporter ATP-binding protein n=1 Tax=Streptomyces sp. NPDC049541 TaxID=3365594 RepID=UPI0037A70BD3